MPTLDHWHSRGGIVGRGVLIDYKSYAEEKNIDFHPFGGNRITVEELEACAEHYGVEFRPGDILLVRTGATEAFEMSTADDLATLQQKQMSGVHGCEDTARWHWNKRSSAAASDSIGFEAFPPVKPHGTPGGVEFLGELAHPLIVHPSCYSI